MEEIPTEIVGKYEVMDPRTEGLLFDGYELKNGMIVIIEDVELRFDVVDNPTSHQAHYLMIMNRWARISNVFVRGQKVEFVATYEDGFTVKRTTDIGKAWIVKTSSRPDYSLLNQTPEPHSIDGIEVDPDAGPIVGNVFETHRAPDWEKQLQQETKPGMKFQTDN